MNMAVENNDIAKVKNFIASNSDINKQDSEGITPLLSCAYYNNYDICELLLKNKANPNLATFQNKLTPLHWASSNENIKLINLLLSYGASINAVTAQYETSLMYSVKNNKLNSVKYLLLKGANPNITNIAGETSLHMAARRLNGDIIKVLIDGGADASAINNQQETAFDVATRFDLKILLANAEEEQREEREIQKNIELAESINKILNEMIKKGDAVGISSYFKQNPAHVVYVKNSQLRLLWSGSEKLRIGDIKKMLISGVGETIIIQMIKRSNVPYVEFSLDEIATLKEMGISDNIIASMLEVTNEILKDEKRKQEFANLLEKQKQAQPVKNYYKYEYHTDKQNLNIEDYMLNKLTDRLIDKMF